MTGHGTFTRLIQRHAHRVGHVGHLHIGTKLPTDDVAGAVIENGREMEPAPADNLEIGKPKVRA